MKNNSILIYILFTIVCITICYETVFCKSKEDYSNNKQSEIRLLYKTNGSLQYKKAVAIYMLEKECMEGTDLDKIDSIFYKSNPDMEKSIKELD